MGVTKEQPCLSFGVIADVQYADADDGYNYAKTRRRYYRTALKMLDNAVSRWNTDTKLKPQFVIQLGDAFDGLNKRQNTSESALSDFLKSFSRFSGSVYHIWGNHEYYNFSREYLLKSGLYSGKLSECQSPEGKCYYSSQPHPKLRIIALDTYEISQLSSQPGTQEYEMATKYMAVNSNEDKNSVVGMSAEMQRFALYNGALSEEQIDWMKKNLQEAEREKQNVIMIGHCGIFIEATDPSCLCWNAPEVLGLVQEHSGSVLCYLSGHDHSGGMAYDTHGILHMAFPGVLENSEAADFGTMYMYTDRLELVGNGRVVSLIIPLKHKLNET